ncbi:MAG: cysteine--tRNA ligase [Patescibacteria group bacterium]|nr:cysteine--tRNA ligase [Patescibacteria group bacterium]
MLRIYNTLSRKIEEFSPLDSPNVGIYSCGPTVYDYQHIGHMRRYVGDDILVRVLEYDDYKVKQVMNITDVGHLVSDADEGEDKMEKGAKKFGMSVWDVAKKFEGQFLESMKLLNIQPPSVLMHATDYIKDQIELVEILEEKGFTYKIADGIYFDTSKFPNYTELSRQNLDEIKAGARVEMVKGKKNLSDFALWKFSPKNSKRQMEWDSPWGKGFPGWHIECSAMSMKALGPTLDIHTGGIDHINIHHTNEIAQSEAASGRKFVNYWVHHAFLMVGDEKMSKSLENLYTVTDIVKKGFNPLALRYLYFQTHYRQEMNFTFEALESAQSALKKLYDEVSSWDEPKIGCAEFESNFFEAINEDLNMPKALAVMWELVKSDYPTSAKAESLFKFDKVLGFDLKNQTARQKLQKSEIPQAVLELIKERDELRKQKRFHLADQLRGKIKKLGYDVEDKKGKTEIKKI